MPSEYPAEEECREHLDDRGSEPARWLRNPQAVCSEERQQYECEVGREACPSDNSALKNLYGTEHAEASGTEGEHDWLEEAFSAEGASDR